MPTTDPTTQARADRGVNVFALCVAGFGALLVWVQVGFGAALGAVLITWGIAGAFHDAEGHDG